MDYHLDWLYAATVLLQANQQTPYSNKKLGIQANQEDIDFIIAFDRTLILIEAKGDTPWSNEQLASKKARLDFMFDADFQPLAGVDKVLYVLMSPVEINWNHAESPSKGLKSKNLPKGVSSDDVWMPLGMDKDLLKITRCDENSKVTHTGTY